jgi:hypothetical protein
LKQNSFYVKEEDKTSAFVSLETASSCRQRVLSLGDQIELRDEVDSELLDGDDRCFFRGYN